MFKNINWQYILNTNWFSAFIGSITAFITTIITLLVSQKMKNKDDTKNSMINLIQLYPKIFEIIFDNYNTGCVDYLTLSKEIRNNKSMFFILPKKIRTPFIELYKIYALEPEKYEECKKNKYIENTLRTIYESITEYGDDIFG